jgi:hypothetical protein
VTKIKEDYLESFEEEENDIPDLDEDRFLINRKNTDDGGNSN